MTTSCICGLYLLNKEMDRVVGSYRFVVHCTGNQIYFMTFNRLLALCNISHAHYPTPQNILHFTNIFTNGLIPKY